MANTINPKIIPFANKARNEIKKQLTDFFTQYQNELFSPQKRLEIVQKMAIQSHVYHGNMEVIITSSKDSNDKSITFSHMEFAYYPVGHGASESKYACWPLSKRFITKPGYSTKSLVSVTPDMPSLMAKIDQLSLDFAYRLVDCYTGYDSKKLNSLSLDEYNEYLAVNVPQDISVILTDRKDNSTQFHPEEGLTKYNPVSTWKNQEGRPISDPFTQQGDDDWFQKLDFTKKPQAKIVMQLVKLANKLDHFGEYERADKIDQMIQRMTAIL